MLQIHNFCQNSTKLHSPKALWDFLRSPKGCHLGPLWHKSVHQRHDSWNNQIRYYICDQHNGELGIGRACVSTLVGSVARKSFEAVDWLAVVAKEGHLVKAQSNTGSEGPSESGQLVKGESFGQSSNTDIAIWSKWRTKSSRPIGKKTKKKGGWFGQTNTEELLNQRRVIWSKQNNGLTGGSTTTSSPSKTPSTRHIKRRWVLQMFQHLFLQINNKMASTFDDGRWK